MIPNKGLMNPDFKSRPRHTAGYPSKASYCCPDVYICVFIFRLSRLIRQSELLMKTLPVLKLAASREELHISVPGDKQMQARSLQELRSQQLLLDMRHSLTSTVAPMKARLAGRNA